MKKTINKNLRPSSESDNEKETQNIKHLTKKIKIKSIETNSISQNDYREHDLNKTKGDLKHELINYYEITKNNIDVKSQNILLKIDEYLNLNNNNLSQERINDVSNYRQMIFKKYQSFIKCIDEICDKNMHEINDIDYNMTNVISINDINDIKKTIIKNYCLYIENQSNSKIIYPIGALISFDWYPSENEINFLK